MTNNNNLHRARSVKNDEYYTLLPTIENEIKHYKDEFRGKIVYCNCDKVGQSNFFRYFADNYSSLNLKGLICTAYNPNGSGSKFEYIGPSKEELGRASAVSLKGDGDFRSQESIDLLEQSDIVVTNPPFSLFREYLDQLFSHGKRFLIIGNMNATTYKEIFPLIKGNKLWWGVTLNGNKDCSFLVPDGFEGKNVYVKDGVRYGKVNNAIWYTNIDHGQRSKELCLNKHYSEGVFQYYDNCNAINVDNVSDIPTDYDGVIGVPVTFIGKYNPNQFEIISFRKGDDGKDLRIGDRYPYSRILIKRKRND